MAAAALFVAIALLIGWDLIADYREGAHWSHIAIELFVLLVAASGAVLLWRQFGQSQLDLADARVDAEQWRNESRELLRGLGIAVEKQFAAWQLTKAEAEVGLFLRKGFSHKEFRVFVTPVNEQPGSRHGPCPANLVFLADRFYQHSSWKIYYCPKTNLTRR